MTDFSSEYLLFKKKKKYQDKLFSCFRCFDNETPSTSRYPCQYLSSIKKRFIFLAHLSRMSLVVSFKLLFALMYMLFYTCTRSPLAKPLIFNASNQIKTFRLYMAGLFKVTLCVLDAEIWIIRVLRVFFEEETRCELQADFSASYLFLSLFENRWQQLFVSHTKKKGQIICIANVSFKRNLTSSLIQSVVAGNLTFPSGILSSIIIFPKFPCKKNEELTSKMKFPLASCE